MDAGLCYLSVVKEEYRPVVQDLVGINPLVWVFLNGVEPYHLDDDKLQSYGWYEGFDAGTGNPVYHIGQTGRGARLATVADVMVAVMGKKAPVSQRCFVESTECKVVLSRDACLGQDMPKVGAVPVHSSLLEMRKSDLTQCFCQVHKQPITRSGDFAVEGCCKRPSGRAEVIAAAFDAKHRMCHAEPSVREADYRFLMAVSSGNDPGCLDGGGRPEWFAALCTSNVCNDRGAFGNGYCYLDAMEKDTWWRCARVLGPNPYVLAVMDVLLWAGKVSAKPMTLKKVKEGYYHLLPDKSYKGVHSRAGRLLAAQMLALVGAEPNARIGMDGSSVDVAREREAVAAFDVRRVKEALRLFRGAMARAKFADKVLVVMFKHKPMMPSWPVITECVAGSAGVVTTSGVIDFCLTVAKQCVLALPLGCILMHDEVEYGAPDVRVLAVVSGSVEFSLKGEVGLPLLYEVVTPVLYPVHAAVAKYCFDAESAASWFVLAADAPVVLRCPKLEHAVMDSNYNVFALTDPLDDWAYILEERFQSDGMKCGQAVRLQYSSVCHYQYFRCASGRVAASFGGCVKLSDRGGGVTMWMVKPIFQLVPDAMPDEYTPSLPDVEVPWSIRTKRVPNDYRLDYEGESSDSEFSECS